MSEDLEMEKDGAAQTTGRLTLQWIETPQTQVWNTRLLKATYAACM